MSLGPEHGTNCEQRVRNAPNCSCTKKQVKKVPLVVSQEGAKTVIGEAVVEVDGDFMEITARVNDPRYRNMLYNLEGFSLGSVSLRRD